MRREQIGAATLYLGDCRELVLDQPARRVVTDPPYKLTSGGKSKGAGVMAGGWMADYSNDGSPVVCDIEWLEITSVIARALPKGDAYVFANDKNVQAMLNAASSSGLRFHNLLVWDKITATANRWYMKNLEFVGYFYSGIAHRINDASSKQLIRAPQVDETLHPTEKPVGLCQVYIENSTKRGELVFDPFVGSGTTAVAAIRSGRTFVGVEVSPQWFDVACQRIEAALRSPELFEAAS